MTFSAFDAVRYETEPKRTRTDIVPLDESNLREVIDPMSAVLFALPPSAAGEQDESAEAEIGQKVCERAAAVFDGRRRFNLRLSYKSRHQAETDGFSGPVFVCAARYEPIAGHRAESKTTRFLAQSPDIEIAFARMGKSRFYTLFGFDVPLRQGALKARSDGFEMSNPN